MLNSTTPYFSNTWRFLGLVATLFLVLSVPIYLVQKAYFTKPYSPEPITFVGRATCVECHQKETELWIGSHHDRAMDSATDQTVLGNFNDFEFKHRGQTHRMFKRNGKFYMNTLGPNGIFEDYEVAFTFGYTPLQQYLVPFDGGRLQCLPIVWDTDKGKWFHLGDTLYPNEELNGDNWLFWTNQAQNWNGMCADCHSTNLQKNFDPKTFTYNTTWSEIDVSCEACHGPASAHLNWAKLPEGSRPENTNTGLVIKTSNLSNEELVNTCVRCHSRRTILSDYPNSNKELLDFIVPQKALPPYYHVDGQILDEDYVYTSFTQSKMFTKDVSCKDCHDVHAAKVIIRGNELCLQCHQPDIYDTPLHHFHKMPKENLKKLINNTSAPTMEEGEGALCVNCHMTGRFYMGNDYRRDHSFRIPRPDLTLSIGTPNACNDCHTDKSVKWAQQNIEKWYGIKKRPHYGTAFAAANSGDTAAIQTLINYAQNEVYPLMVRASAVAMLANYNNSTSFDAIKQALTAPESLIRHAAVGSFQSNQLNDYLLVLAPLLNDQVKAIRAETAYKFSEIPRNMLDEKILKKIDAGLNEFEQNNLYMADFSGGQLNLGNLYLHKNELAKAEQAYKQAIAIDKLFYQARTNLAMVYNRQGKNQEAEKIFKELIRDFPELPGLNYSLALLLAEMNKPDESKTYLLKATQENPENSRIWYNLAVLESKTEGQNKAEYYYKKALDIDPDNYEILWGLAFYYYSNNQNQKAKTLLLNLKESNPDDVQVSKLLKMISN
jgi:Tfp pilus assembly protein PilF